VNRAPWFSSRQRSGLPVLALTSALNPKTKAKTPKASSTSGVVRGWQLGAYLSSKYAATSGNTIVASDSMMKRGVSTASLPQVIFSPGGAPLYEP